MIPETREEIEAAQDKLMAKMMSGEMSGPAEVATAVLYVNLEIKKRKLENLY